MRATTNRRTIFGALAIGLALSGCAAADQPAEADVSVVATTTIWADIAGQVVDCAGTGSVRTLMPIGADPHEFSASSEDLATMAGADLVIANGLGLEEGLTATLEASRTDGVTVFEVAPLLDPLPFGGESDQPQVSSSSDVAQHSQDPHMWLDISRVATAAQLIGAELTKQTGMAKFTECGDTVKADLDELALEVRQTLQAVPDEHRVLVTDHDALGYFAAANDFEVVGTVVPGGSTLAQPSSKEMAELVSVVASTGVPAIFANTANPTALVDALASEVGDIEVVPLYIGSLGEPGSGADTYQTMMRTNAQRISAALAG